MSASSVSVSIMGKWYDIPLGLTILQAYEYVGFHLVRGVGCRGGLCGACATIYRIASESTRRSCLSCQTSVEAGMILTGPQFFPANRPRYDLVDLKDPVRAPIEVYPEVQNCVGCNACTKICPKDIDVMSYVAALLRGELKRASDLSFDCVMCGLCAIVCPAEISQYNAALLARRVCAKHLVKRSANVSKRTAEIRNGQYTEELLRLMAADEEELKKLYLAREFKNN